jgi:hypothetical protein
MSIGESHTTWIFSFTHSFLARESQGYCNLPFIERELELLQKQTKSPSESPVPLQFTLAIHLGKIIPLKSPTQHLKLKDP